MSLAVAWCDGSRSHSADGYPLNNNTGKNGCKEKKIAGLCYRVVNGAITSPPQSCTKTGVYKWSALPAGSGGRLLGQCFASEGNPKDGPQEPVDVCKPKDGPREDPNFFSQVQKCGYYKPLCPDLTVVFANVDYPHLKGEMPSLRYIVQVDIGKYPNEDCHEMIVKGNVDWGHMYMGDYGCMGGCGPGCAAYTWKLGYSLDCLKHDVCSGWNAHRLKKSSRGFCKDLDCGDEAAQATWTCTSKTTGKPSECEDGKTTGKFWTSHENKACSKFADKGQGLVGMGPCKGWQVCGLKKKE